MLHVVLTKIANVVLFHQFSATLPGFDLLLTYYEQCFRLFLISGVIFFDDILVTKSDPKFILG